MLGSPRVQLRDDWDEFLGSLDGEPRRIVCDQDRTMVSAVRARWPAVRIHHCEWHLRNSVNDKLKTVGLNTPGVLVHDLVGVAFVNTTGWDRFKQAALATRRRELRNLVRRLEPLVRDQLAHRPSYETSRDPFTTGALDERLRALRHSLDPRAGRLTNRERLNRALLLMQLHLNGQANETAYARALHDWLLSGGGRPRTPRRAINDRKGQPSLRP